MNVLKRDKFYVFFYQSETNVREREKTSWIQRRTEMVLLRKMLKWMVLSAMDTSFSESTKIYCELSKIECFNPVKTFLFSTKHFLDQMVLYSGAEKKLQSRWDDLYIWCSINIGIVLWRSVHLSAIKRGHCTTLSILSILWINICWIHCSAHSYHISIHHIVPLLVHNPETQH